MKDRRFISRLLPGSVVLILVLAGVFLISIFSFNFLYVLFSVPAPLHGDFMNSVNEKISGGEFGEPLQQAIDSNILYSPEILTFLVVDRNGRILAAYPRELVGEDLIKIEKEDAGVSVNKLFSESPSGDCMIYCTWKKDADRAGYPQLAKGYRDTSGKMFRISFVIFWVLLALWVYRDARRKGLNAPAWGILVFLTNVVGWAVYTITQPKTMKCPECDRVIESVYKACPFCGCRLKSTELCKECQQEVKDDWSYCAECGTALNKKEPETE